MRANNVEIRLHRRLGRSVSSSWMVEIRDTETKHIYAVSVTSRKAAAKWVYNQILRGWKR